MAEISFVLMAMGLTRDGLEKMTADKSRSTLEQKLSQMLCWILLFIMMKQMICLERLIATPKENVSG